MCSFLLPLTYYWAIPIYSGSSVCLYSRGRNGTRALYGQRVTTTRAASPPARRPLATHRAYWSPDVRWQHGQMAPSMNPTLHTKITADNSTAILLVNPSILHVPEPIANSQKVLTLFSLDSESTFFTTPPSAVVASAHHHYSVNPRSFSIRRFHWYSAPFTQSPRNSWSLSTARRFV